MTVRSFGELDFISRGDVNRKHAAIGQLCKCIPFIPVWFWIKGVMLQCFSSPSVKCGITVCTTFKTIALIAMNLYFQLVFPEFNCPTVSKTRSGLIAGEAVHESKVMAAVYIENIVRFRNSICNYKIYFKRSLQSVADSYINCFFFC